MTIEDTTAAVADTTDTTTDTTATVANPDTATATAPDKVEGQDQAEADKVEDPVGAPEAYADFALPEGYTLDGERLEAAQTKFKALNLTQVQAQELVDFYCSADGENATVRQQFLESERSQRIEQWGQQAKSELGAKYDESLALARAGVESVKSDALMAAFESEGWGNHPELIKVFAKLGELTRGSGPKGLEGETTTTDRSSIPIEKRLYPNMA
jgi:hypothetical protein